MTTYKLDLSEMLSGLTHSQRQLLTGIIGLTKFKYPTIPGPPMKKDQFAIMGVSHLILAKHGWFISLFLTPCETSFTAATYFLPRKFDKDKGDEIMAEHYRATLNEIQKEAEDQFPNRRLILNKAFRAHRDSNYELSIPVMLAQADGIGREIFGDSPYKSKKAIFKKHIEQKLHPLSVKLFREYYFCVAQELSIKKSTSSDTKPPFPLNRHLVLHGISTDYATEVNAFKTVSWLQYIISFKTEARPAK